MNWTSYVMCYESTYELWKCWIVIEHEVKWDMAIDRWLCMRMWYYVKLIIEWEWYTFMWIEYVYVAWLNVGEEMWGKYEIVGLSQTDSLHWLWKDNSRADNSSSGHIWKDNLWDG